MSDKDHVCPVCGGGLYRVANRLRCGRCAWGWPWAVSKSRKRKPAERKAA
jgi:hypothetical protein